MENVNLQFLQPQGTCGRAGFANWVLLYCLQDISVPCVQRRSSAMQAPWLHRPRTTRALVGENGVDLFVCVEWNRFAFLA